MHSLVRSSRGFSAFLAGTIGPGTQLGVPTTKLGLEYGPARTDEKKSLDKHGQVLKLTNSDQPTVRASELELRLLVVTVQRLSVVFKHYHSTPPQLSVTLVNFLIDKNTVSRVTHFHQKCPFCTIAVPLNIS